MHKAPRQVIFDLDHTLVTSAHISPSWGKACADYGLDADKVRQVMDMNQGLPLWNILDLVGVDAQIADKIIDHFWKLVEKADLDVEAMPGAEETVRRLGGAGLDLYLMTGSRPETAMHALETLDLLDYFTLVLGSRKGCLKGSDHYRMVIKSSGLNQAEFAATTATIGDGAADMRFGRDFGLHWRIGFNPTKDRDYTEILRLAGATAVISDLDQVLVWIE